MNFLEKIKTSLEAIFSNNFIMCIFCKVKQNYGAPNSYITNDNTNVLKSPEMVSNSKYRKYKTCKPQKDKDQVLQKNK